MIDEKRRQRLIFRSKHRGTNEMDLLLGSFADAQVPGFTDAQLDQYEAVLSQPDPDLYNWIVGAEKVPAEHESDVMRMLVGHQYKRQNS